MTNLQACVLIVPVLSLDKSATHYSTTTMQDYVVALKRGLEIKLKKHNMVKAYIMNA